MKQFIVYPVVEYRTDDKSWVMWRVKHVDGKDYLMAYSNGKLKEVYFVGEGYDDYFMSCRADFSVVSHYVVDRYYSVVRRYENGVMNRLYRDDKKGTMTCDTHKYVQKMFTTEVPDIERLYVDLSKFLDDFSKSGIKIERPKYAR
jgi:hypothetical protein